jgi:hypothetical protein
MPFYQSDSRLLALVRDAGRRAGDICRNGWRAGAIAVAQAASDP